MDQFISKCRELADLKSALAALAWDQETMMPPLGAAFRARQMATLSSLYHTKLIDSEWEEILAELSGQDLPPWQDASIKELAKQRRKAKRVPDALVRDLAETTSLAYEHWVQARQRSDFGRFQPWLEKVVDLKRREAGFLQDGDTLYEALLDEYEPEMTEATLDSLFGVLRPALTDLLRRILESDMTGRIPRLKGDFPLAVQEMAAKEVLTDMGFDWEAGRLDRSPHPFCTGLTPRDVRITTRYNPSDFTASFFGCVHEGGHALYEQGLDPERYGLPACDAISLGVHESQSRLWENQIARGVDFWTGWLPRLQVLFPDPLQGWSLQDFLLTVNRVEASLIRVEADEVTYGLHIILRYELERQLIEGSVEVADLPREWNDRMEEYLGIRPENDAEGVLQDTHWSHGLIGYFPTYLLGNLYAAQLIRTAFNQIDGLTVSIQKRNFLPLRSWLQEKIHSLGRTKTAEQMIQDVCGEPLQAEPFLDYLTEKFTGLYEL